ncbi:MAG: hypothetical protein BZY87_00505 [SAR202 cluster bacterium Io17-Chloro-G6]|nr:MAG: hypothetical protein BZY87_00505 [SAR202 cluster bacterium Io17-Chloro-G6]
MNTTIGKSLGLTLIMFAGVMATMLALGLFGPGKANAAAPTPQSMTASPGSPGDTSSIKIGFETDSEIAGNSGELWIAFDAKYGVPDTIAKTSISIASGQTTGGVSNPLIDPTIATQIAASSPLSVSDTVVKLQLGDTAPNSTGTVEGLSVNTGGNDHTVTFATSAGITLPTAASTKEIWLSKDQGTTWSTATATAGTNAITVVRELTLSATSGARGKAVTATGKGFTTTGNATLWIDTDDGADIDAGEYIIASDIAVSGGKFEHTFTTDTNFPLSATAINAQGGDGNTVSASTNPAFTSYGSISLDKSEVARGASLKVTAIDIAAGTITAITIGGVASTLPTDVTIDTTGVDETFTVTVAATTPLGVQKIVIDTNNEADRYTTVTITGAPVTVSPSTAVANQEVTVTGTGFTKSDGIATVTVGGQTATYTSSGGLATTTTLASVDTDSSGNFSTSFLIPDSSTTRTAGAHKILVTDDSGLTGEVFVTVPGRTLSLSVETSKRASEVTVTGTGYEAKGTVVLTYTSGTSDTALGSAVADSYGEFTKVVTIPNTPSIPSTNTITGAITSGGSQTVTHKIGAASITTDVAEQSTGENITITGVGFPAYATIGTLTIGGLDVRPTPAPSTDVDGGFSSTVMVPGLTEGNHTVKVTASSITGSISIKVTATTATVVEVSTATVDVFADSIAADNLVRVWRYSNADQSWSFYDPRDEFADVNTLTDTASGDIVWVNVTAEESFQSTTLYSGWNLISLD